MASDDQPFLTAGGTGVFALAKHSTSADTQGRRRAPAIARGPYVEKRN